jgi:hypothetical protein
MRAAPIIIVGEEPVVIERSAQKGELAMVGLIVHNEFVRSEVAPYPNEHCDHAQQQRCRRRELEQSLLQCAVSPPARRYASTHGEKGVRGREHRKG